MQFKDRIKAVLAGEVLILLLLLVVPQLPENKLWFLLLAAAQGGLIAATAGLIWLPLLKTEGILKELNTENYQGEDISHRAGELPYGKTMAELIERYASELTRRNTAEIFDKQTELTALQSQINPHFLYNTLETIRGQALIDDNYEIARMTEALGAFFRYSISRKGNLVTLRDELANIDNYMLIQSYRFNNRFSLEVILDEEDQAAYDYLIPRLIIQPVVENAIFHGLEEMGEGGKVTIEILVTEDKLILIVSDNGVGIAEEDLKKLNERIHSGEKQLEDQAGKSRHGTGIALPNIHRRIQLLFGDEYGVQVYSTLGQGTDVEIVIPADYRRKEGLNSEEGTDEDQQPELPLQSGMEP